MERRSHPAPHLPCGQPGQALHDLEVKARGGIELLGTVNRLACARDPVAAARWLADYNAWCVRWEGFLKEFTFRESRRVYAHERPRRAGRSLNKLVREGVPFAYIEMQEPYGGAWPAANNALESVSARLRERLRNHRGMTLLHRIKAAFWWCCLHAEAPLPALELLRVMPTDAEVDCLFESVQRKLKRDDRTPEKYGTGIDWGFLEWIFSGRAAGWVEIFCSMLFIGLSWLPSRLALGR